MDSGSRRPPRWRSDTAGCRCSRTRARSWAARTRTRTARSGLHRALPNEAANEDGQQRAYSPPMAAAAAPTTSRCERADGARIVLRERRLGRVVPFWAVWPFETLIAARAAARALPDLAPARGATSAGCSDAAARATTTCSGSRSPTRWAGTERPRRRARAALAAARALLPAAAALGHRQEVHGRLRDAGRTPSATSPPRPPPSGCAS